ncbi:MAG: glycerophosphodiester phosphodiesterase [Nevskia sp.]|jgi:glycerophosphoryl diester phosphodiesterase|nr:glycerophosphodiester phosphodiesterase [Nevskia sp.]
MRIAIQFAALALTAAILAPHAATAAEAADTERAQPIVIGHRGSAGYRPEHTLASYALAIELGVDYIEPDLVSTRDHVLVARHENDISATTDVANHPEFADRRATKQIDGVSITGWFTEDFTLAELKTLRAVERLPELRQRNTLYNGLYAIPTLQEVIDLARRKSIETGRRIGIYPETKHPSYFDSIGLSLEAPLLATLRRNGLDRRNAPVFIQSFEVSNLRALRQKTRVHLIQLIDAADTRPADFVIAGINRTYGDLTTPAGLAEIARYADGIGPPKTAIVPRDAAGNSLAATTLVRDAHAAGLLVHPYTFRNENNFLPAELRVGDAAAAAYPTFYGRALDEYRQFFALGVDGVFSDNGDTAIEARRPQTH